MHLVLFVSFKVCWLLTIIITVEPTLTIYPYIDKSLHAIRMDIINLKSFHPSIYIIINLERKKIN